MTHRIALETELNLDLIPSMCLFQERLLLITSLKNFVSIAVKNVFVNIRNLHVRVTCTFIGKLDEIIFVIIQGKQISFEPFI